MKKCSSCRNELSEYYRLSSMVRDSFSSADEVDFSSSIIASVMMDEGDALVPMSVRKKKLIGLGSVAAALVAGLMALTMMNSGERNMNVAGNEKLEKYVFEHVASTYDGSDGEISVVNYGQ
jgi:homoserine kinase